MFTGIIEEVGRVRSAGSGRLTITCKTVLEGTKPGDSIAVNGACLTVTTLDAGSFSIDVMPETLRLTNLGRQMAGSPENLERALTPSSRIGGHLVQGHVDGTAKVSSLKPEREAVIMSFNAPPQILRYIVVKGFVAVDGASLTVTACDESAFSVSLVKFTQVKTNLGARRAGDEVNIEGDSLAKYVEKLVNKERPALTAEFLRERGF